MYKKIINPINGKKVNIYSKLGKQILYNYIKVGGATASNTGATTAKRGATTAKRGATTAMKGATTAKREATTSKTELSKLSDDEIGSLCNKYIKNESKYDIKNNDRTIVIGDIHGDIQALIYCLRNCANVINKDNNWIGDDTRVVLCGDMIDRNRRSRIGTGGTWVTNNTITDDNGKGIGEIADEEIKIQRLLNKLSLQSNMSGGKIIKLLGNHEIEHLNCKWNEPGCNTFSSNYSTNFGLRNENGSDRTVDNKLSFINPNYSNQDPGGRMMVSSVLNNTAKNRLINYAPGGPSSKLLLNCGGRIIVQIGDWIFVHGGVLPQIVRNIYGLMGVDITVSNSSEIFLDKANELLIKKYNNKLTRDDIKLWTQIINQPNGIVWNRTYGRDFKDTQCDIILPTLFQLLGFKNSIKNGRIVVAHCTQKDNGLFDTGNVFILRKSSETKTADVFGPANAKHDLRCNYVKICDPTWTGPSSKCPKISQLNHKCPKTSGINYQCPDKNGLGRVWRVDVGMSRAFDLMQEIDFSRKKGFLQDYWNSRKPQVMEITHYNDKSDVVKVLRSKDSLPRNETIMDNYLKATYGGKYYGVDPHITWKDLKPTKYAPAVAGTVAGALEPDIKKVPKTSSTTYAPAVAVPLKPDIKKVPKTSSTTCANCIMMGGELY